MICLLTFLFGNLVLLSSVKASPPICTSPAGSVCPKDTLYYFCLTGPASGGCSPSFFSQTSCQSQCITSGFSLSPSPSPTQISACSTATPCPLDVQYYFCQAGVAANGCQKASGGPFPLSSCSQQCSTSSPLPSPSPPPSISPSSSPSPAQIGACSTSTPCPTDTQYYFCKLGSAINGCQKINVGPFPTASCSQQCLTTNLSPQSSPSPSSSPSMSPSSSPSQSPSSTRTFRVFNKCEKSIWVAALSLPMPTLLSPTWELLPGSQPLVLSVPATSASGRLWGRTGCQTSVTLQVCATGSAPCPSGADYIYCKEGGSANGCRLSSQGPFSPASCSSQCVKPATVNSQTTYNFPSFSCQTGDCNGQQSCSLSGNGPATLFEWTFTSDGSDIYDISAVDGFNLGMKVTPTGTYQQRLGQACDSPSCSMDTSKCPPELQINAPGSPGGKACMSICAAVYSSSQRALFPILQNMYTAHTPSGKLVRDLVCCSCGDNCGGTCGCDSSACAYGCSPYVTTYPPSYSDRSCHVEQWPLASNGKSYIETFSTQCPGVYSWQFDDVKGLHYCSVADYDITFCG